MTHLVLATLRSPFFGGLPRAQVICSATVHSQKG